jgi:hypothetical protein
MPDSKLGIDGPGGANSLDSFRKRGESLPLTVEAFDRFNRDIQAAILAAPGPFEATQLAQLKLETNRRIYNSRRPDA